QKLERFPTINELPDILASSLKVKLPIPQGRKGTDLIANFPDILCSNTEVNADELSVIIASALITMQSVFFTTSYGEDMMHYIIDTLIRAILGVFHNNDYSRKLSVGFFLCWLEDVLFLKGKEKASQNSFNAARNELTEKLGNLDPIYFGGVRYIFCYVAAGNKFQFYVIDKQKSLHALRQGLTLVIHRLKIIQMVVNIIRVMVTANVEKILPKNVLPLGEIRQKGSTEIIFMENFILSTRGFHWELGTEDDLRQAAEDILHGLHELHIKGYIHRDIRWENVLRVLDHSVNGNEIKISSSWDHKTLENGKYTKASDMYEFGKLLNARNLVESSTGRQFLKKLEEHHATRMSAIQALQHSWITRC
ncbi:6155_t:CDS:2, partial [Funneliformis geosporum]